MESWSRYAKIYDPIKVGSIDGTDTEPHDRAIVRALNSTYRPNRFVKGKPQCTIFVSRLNHKTTKETIRDVFSKYGKLKRFRLVRDIVTGTPKGYAFVEYETEAEAEEAYRKANRINLEGNLIFVDFECERLLKGWKPRRLGGGFGGKKESGQLRFGGRDRPFKKPIGLEIRERERKDSDRGKRNFCDRREEKGDDWDRRRSRSGKEEWEKKEWDRRILGRRDVSKREADRRDLERKDLERGDVVKKDSDKRELSKRDLDRYDLGKKDIERKEIEVKEVEKSEEEKRDIDRRFVQRRDDVERKEGYKKDWERKEKSRNDGKRYGSRRYRERSRS